MKRAAILGAAILLTVALAGCGGDFLSPTATDYETTTTTTTTTAAAELSQDNNRPLCVGLFNIGACNVVQVNTQHVNRPAGSPAPADAGPDLWQTLLTLFALLAAFGAAMAIGTILLGNRGYNA